MSIFLGDSYYFFVVSIFSKKRLFCCLIVFYFISVNATKGMWRLLKMSYYIMGNIP